MIILGVNYNHPCASAAFVVDGELKFAIAEERLTRKKYDGSFPMKAIQCGLTSLGLKGEDIDYIALGKDPHANKTQKYLFSLKNPLLLTNMASLRSRSKHDNVSSLLRKALNPENRQARYKIKYVEHHIAHIASSFFTSNYTESAGVSIDGSGDFVTCMYAHCKGSSIEPIHRIFVPNSLGSFYFTGCQYIGYNQYGDEGKVMGLAPYGEDTYGAIFQDMIDFKNSTIKLNSKFFKPFGSDQGALLNSDGTTICHRHYTDFYEESFFGKARTKSDEIEKKHMDFAFGLQKQFENIYFEIFNDLYDKLPFEKVAIAGGCALNSVANGKLLSRTKFKGMSIHSAPADDGIAAGAALYVAHQLGSAQSHHTNTSCYLGRSYCSDELTSYLERSDVDHILMRDEDSLHKAVARLISHGLVVGSFQSKSEWGPRALGNRSIFAHPGFPRMKDILNERIKKRESFRPFAPAVLDSFQDDVFESRFETPYMLHVFKVRKKWRSQLKAITHIDFTGRVQTLKESYNRYFYSVTKEFHKITGIPVLLNTSFNENEPIVETPQHAIDCYLRTKMDALILGNYIVIKQKKHYALIQEQLEAV